MLLFIFDKPSFSFLSCKVSIHLMLLFIDFIAGEYAFFYSVSIHLMLLFIEPQMQDAVKTMRFNTSHVTLYQDRKECIIYTGTTFQYISCYSLSADDNATPVLSAVFQYISCYSLSALQRGSRTPFITFQYISCYSLSLVL